MSRRGGPLHGHQEFQHPRFVESDGGNDEIDLLMLKDSKGVGGGVNDDEIADITQHRLKHLRSMRLRGEQNPRRRFHAHQYCTFVGH
jgi:hypothetical protein